jgi:nickel-dependent lactate racemase
MMGRISLPYGEGVQTAVVLDQSNLTVVSMPQRVVTRDEDALLEEALYNPIHSRKLEDLVSHQDRIAIIVNDHTRPGPTRKIVAALMKRLTASGISDSHICFVVATGTHRAPTATELEEIIGAEPVRRIKTICHDCRDSSSLVYIGESEYAKLPVYINKTVAEATFRIATGLIAPHHRAGFSGGRKSILPGVAGFETIRLNHSFPISSYEPAIGILDGNLVHRTALEAAKKIGVDFIVNSVTDPDKRNVAFVAGDLEAAHAAGVKISQEVCSVEINQLADIVVASPGGYPRDRNLWQSQKALSAAEVLVKAGGTIILVAECRDGIGEGVFREWLAEACRPEEVIERYRREGFTVGGNKACMVARALTRARIIVVSDKLSHEELKSMHLEGARNLDEAFSRATSKGGSPHILIVPKAVTMIPVLSGNEKY